MHFLLKIGISARYNSANFDINEYTRISDYEQEQCCTIQEPMLWASILTCPAPQTVPDQLMTDSCVGCCGCVQAERDEVFEYLRQQRARSRSCFYSCHLSGPVPLGIGLAHCTDCCGEGNNYTCPVFPCNLM